LLHEHDEFIDVRVIPDMQLFFDGKVIDSRTASEINKIYTFLNDFPDSAKSQIDKGVGGNHGRIADALAKMEAAGVISKVKEGNAHRYRTRKQLNIEKR
jgi:DNA-binding transcriptional regulator PaaX